MSTRPPWEDYQTEERPPWEDYGTAVVAAPAAAVDDSSPLQKFLRQIIQTKVPSLVTAALPGGAAIRNPLTGEGSLEQGLENLPAAGGTVGALLGGPGGAALGAMGGEAWRQNARSAAGLPASTGLLQRKLKLDPSSVEASVTGMAAEAALTPVGKAATTMLEALSAGAKNSGLRSLVNLVLHPRGQRMQDEAMGLAAVMRKEGLAPTTADYLKDLVKFPFTGKMPTFARTTRSNLFKDANELRMGAKQELAAEKATQVAAGAEVPYGNVLRKGADNIPPPLQSGARPETGEAQRRAAEKALDDAVGDVSNFPSGKVPVDVALDIKQRWDKMLKPFYKSNTTDARESLQATQTIADAWRGAIKDALPNLGDKLTRSSDLIAITDLLRKAHKAGVRLGDLRPANEGAGGRLMEHIPILKWLRSAHNSAQWASLSAAGQDTLASILKEGSVTVPIWLRLADQFNVPEAQEAGQSPRPEEKSLKDLANSILERRANPPSVSEEEFIRRYE